MKKVFPAWTYPATIKDIHDGEIQK